MTIDHKPLIKIDLSSREALEEILKLRMQSQMAEMIKIQSLPIFADDLRGTYSVSDFTNNMPGQLVWSDNKSISHLKLFWSQDHHSQFSSNKDLEAIIEKVKSAMEGLDLFHLPTLVQLWAPKRVKTSGNQQLLVTSDLPFGINLLIKGLCLYRKLCLDYKYSLDGEEELGPVGRVFRDGFPEFSPYVSCYSIQEFKSRDCAVSCGVYGYLALPVFEAVGEQCVCVLELIAVWDGNYYLTDTIGKVSQALKAVGLRTSNIHWLIDMERSSQHEFALCEIEKGLKAVCHAHGIPFAQAWFASTGKNYTEIVMCTSERASTMLRKKVSSFQKDCIQFGLKKGQNVVWKAFRSCTSYFCRDIKQLSINEYSLVLSARKVGLTASFAICLESLFTGNDVYVLEFFLPFKHTIYNNPPTCLNSLLATVKQHFQRFKFASRQQQGTGRNFDIIDLDTGDGVNTNTKNDEPVATQNKGAVVKASENMVLGNQSGKEQLENTECIFDVSVPKQKQLHGKFGLDLPSNKRKADHSLSQQRIRSAENHNAKSSERDQACSVPHPEEGTRDNESVMMVKASYKEVIIKFQLSLSSGIMDFENEVKKRLNLTAGSFEIKYQNEHDDCILLASDADLQNVMYDMLSVRKKTLKLLLEPVENQDSEKQKRTNSMQMLRDSFMTIKATYKDDTIKFQLSMQSGLLELKSEILKRLKLKDDSFEIKYQGENNEFIPVDSDTDLQNCMNTARSLEKQTIKLLLIPEETGSTAASVSAAQAVEMQNGSTMTIKATYKEDIIKFQISASSGLMELKNEVTKRLKLSSESFRVKYEDVVDNWIYLSGDADLQNHLNAMALSNRYTVKFHLEPIKN